MWLDLPQKVLWDQLLFLQSNIIPPWKTLAWQTVWTHFVPLLVTKKSFIISVPIVNVIKLFSSLHMRLVKTLFIHGKLLHSDCMSSSKPRESLSWSLNSTTLYPYTPLVDYPENKFPSVDTSLIWRSVSVEEKRSINCDTRWFTYKDDEDDDEDQQEKTTSDQEQKSEHSESNGSSKSVPTLDKVKTAGNEPPDHSEKWYFLCTQRVDIYLKEQLTVAVLFLCVTMTNFMSNALTKQ